MLKDFLIEMIADSKGASSEFKDSQKKGSSFARIRPLELYCVNMFLKQLDRSSTRSGLFDFSKTQAGHLMIGVFSESELTGMVEVTDYDSLDQISPSLGALTDVMFRAKRNEKFPSF